LHTFEYFPIIAAHEQVFAIGSGSIGGSIKRRVQGLEVGRCLCTVQHISLWLLPLQRGLLHHKRPLAIEFCLQYASSLEAGPFLLRADQHFVGGKGGP
jgi:hypothetical protein